MTDKRHLDDAELEAMFAAGRAEAPLPRAALVERVLADAEAELARRRPAPAVVRRRAWRGWLAAIGGWPSLAGVAAAGVAGLMIGIAAPDSVAGMAGLSAGEGDVLAEFIFSVDAVLDEG